MTGHPSMGLCPVTAAPSGSVSKAGGGEGMHLLGRRRRPAFTMPAANTVDGTARMRPDPDQARWDRIDRRITHMRWVAVIILALVLRLSLLLLR
jgi:hypothetical protein